MASPYLYGHIRYCHTGIYLGGLELDVAQKGLDVAYVNTPLQKMRCDRMPEHMARDVARSTPSLKVY